LPGNWLAAITAAAAQQGKTHERNQVGGRKLVMATRTPGVARDDGLASMEAMNHGIEKAADNQSKNKNKKNHTKQMSLRGHPAEAIPKTL